MRRKLAAAAAAALVGALALAGPAQADHESGDTSIHSSPALPTSSHGALGWSCPAGTFAVDGGHHATHPVDVSELMQPETQYPHHTTGPNETGWWVQNGETPQEIIVWVQCAENPPRVDVSPNFDCDTITLTFNNAGPYTDGIGHVGPWDMTFDYRLPGDEQLPLEPELEGLSISDPPLAGQPFDGLYNPVPVPAGEIVPVDVSVEPGTEWIEFRLVRGAEQRLFFDWQRIDLVKDLGCPVDDGTGDDGTGDDGTGDDGTGDDGTGDDGTGDDGTGDDGTGDDGTGDDGTGDDGQGGGDTGDDEKDLPATGAPMPLMVGGGLALLLAGAGAMLLARRREVTNG